MFESTKVVISWKVLIRRFSLFSFYFYLRPTVSGHRRLNPFPLDTPSLSFSRRFSFSFSLFYFSSFFSFSYSFSRRFSVSVSLSFLSLPFLVILLFLKTFLFLFSFPFIYLPFLFL